MTFLFLAIGFFFGLFIGLFIIGAQLYIRNLEKEEPQQKRMESHGGKVQFIDPVSNEEKFEKAETVDDMIS